MSRRDYTPPIRGPRDIGPQGSAAGGRWTPGTPSWITLLVIAIVLAVVLLLSVLR
jgi:hypothetical protein